MGNVGSTHHLNLESVNSEIPAYYKFPHSTNHHQSHSQRCDNSGCDTMHWTRSLPHIINNARVDAAGLERDNGALTTMLPNYKVLPQVNERLKLRSTSNGVILFSGGTISGKREQFSTNTEAISEMPKSLGLKQRSRTFIYDDVKQVNMNHTLLIPKTSDQRRSFQVFRRSQTVLELKPDIEQKQNRDSKSLGKEMVFGSTKPKEGEEVLKNMKTFQIQEEDTDQVTTKLNKYHKKRKAPPAPFLSQSGPKSATIVKSLPNIENKYLSGTMANNSIAGISKVTASSENRLENKMGDHPTKSRLFRSNVKMSQSKMAAKKVQEPQLQTQSQLMDVETVFASLSVTPLGDRWKEIHLRRKKSSEAHLVRQKNVIDGNNIQLLPAAGVKLKSPTPSQLKTRSSKNTNIQQKFLSSKIPQLNRTFYFGMFSGSVQALAAKEDSALAAESTRQRDGILNTKKTEHVETSTTAACNATDADIVNDYKIHQSSDTKPIMDNGLLIQVRPTLPRRQLNTPSFSPVTAWRMLVNQQHHHKYQKLAQTCDSKIKNSGDKYINSQTSANSALLPYLTGKEAVTQSICTTLGAAERPAEVPIKLTTNIAKSPSSTFLNTWTPQQDLGDDDDDDYGESAVDVAKKQISEIEFQNHIDQKQNSTNCEQGKENSSKQDKLRAVNRNEANIGSTMSTSAMHVFSLSLPRDVHTQAQRKFLQSINTSSTLPKEPTYSADNSASSPYKPISFSPKCCCLPDGSRVQQYLPLALDGILSHERHCPLNYGLGILIDGSEPLSNLSDNWVLHKVKNSESETLNICRSTEERYRKWNTTASVEPISLSYVTAGKHIMYLPSKDPNTTNTQHQYKQQQYRQKVVRQSTPDELTKPGNYSLAASNVPLKDASDMEKSQQFTSQSNVRRPEKKRLPERLAKDVKLKEAQRKSELETMKRVEDDFHRKRSFEKANIRHQLQLHFSAEKDAIATDDKNSFAETINLLQYDRNNNIACRVDPEGAEGTGKARARKSMQNYSDCGDESDTDAAELVKFKRSETLLEPYLQSIIK